jgi:hypothetical protein
MAQQKFKTLRNDEKSAVMQLFAFSLKNIEINGII